MPMGQSTSTVLRDAGSLGPGPDPHGANPFEQASHLTLYALCSV
jgi:hypothetical protein